MSDLSADEIVALLGLVPHPEGGHYAESWRAPAPDGARPAGTAIYFLLRAGEVSHWHRVDATEVWHHYAGAALALEIATDDHGPIARHVLGTDLANDERPQVVVPAHAWQAARSLGVWTLVGCTVSPAFDFASFVLAPPDWKPGAVT
jgi:uncharacterized protein